MVVRKKTRTVEFRHGSTSLCMPSPGGNKISSRLIVHASESHNKGKQQHRNLLQTAYV
ncbi:uncharacterized protein CCOS01_00080 [Colletotrichum costaricense]|uniref:Uncharacterized protein n=1 Tax=Colletotrichum costaricense TaxID=1209916 RepID=A0AAI9Z9Y8_9PEZI|nr:uncharacterized protein CCOS01_00080 [Colletotrichum costaricense]KAK1538766.1 hypothetical protein CCOS01_00080 [Colletotrichum costaricense]